MANSLGLKERPSPLPPAGVETCDAIGGVTRPNCHRATRCSSLDVPATREDAWDRDESVPGLSDRRDRGGRVGGVTATCRTVRCGCKVERRGIRWCPCSGCGRRTGRVRDMKERTRHDLPWAAHPVTVVYHQRRVRCRHCGNRTERIEFADPKARVTRRLQQLIEPDLSMLQVRGCVVAHTSPRQNALRYRGGGALSNQHSAAP